MILLKYSPLFFIYYILRPYDRKDLPKSIILNLVVIISVAVSLATSGKNNEVLEYKVRDYAQIDSNLAVPTDFRNDLEELNSENKDLLDIGSENSENSEEKDDENTSKIDKNHQIWTIKTYLRNSKENLNIPETYILFSWWLISQEDTNNFSDIVPATVTQNNSELIDIKEIKDTEEVIKFLNKEKYDITISNIFNSISSKQLNQEQSAKLDNIIDEIDNNPNEIFLYNAGDNMVDNIVKTYIRATDSKLQLDRVEINITPTVKSLPKGKGLNGLSYYWQNSIYDNLNKGEKKRIVGPLGEVGYKNDFPVFIQGDPVDKLSKLKWKFAGSETTLGDAACSLYSLCSLLHAAGYGDRNIPGTDDIPTMQNLMKYFTNGPITGVHANQYYDVKFRSTATSEGQEEIFQDLLVGVPYIVNVRSGLVTAYKPDGTTMNTIFTSTGHFMIMESAKIEDGRRLVSLVQSSRSDASLGKLDQNNAWFDYDEIISKGVLRSSAGIAVPAYTIVGGNNLPLPRYLSMNNNRDRLDNIIKHKNDNKWLKEFVEIFDIDITESMENGSNVEKDKVIKFSRPVVANYIDDNVIIFITKDNGILLTNISMKSSIEGKRKPDSVIGITTKNTKAFIVQRTEDGWQILKTGITKDEGESDNE